MVLLLYHSVSSTLEFVSLTALVEARCSTRDFEADSVSLVKI